MIRHKSFRNPYAVDRANRLIKSPTRKQKLVSWEKRLKRYMDTDDCTLMDFFRGQDIAEILAVLREAIQDADDWHMVAREKFMELDRLSKKLNK